MRLPRIHKARAGFTLIELLVVIGLILVLVGITVSVSYSGLIDGYKTVGAGDRASGWLLISKSKATREGAPRGVRFIIGPAPTYYIKEAQYIEVPDPFVPRVVDANAKLYFIDDKRPVPEVKRIFVVGNAALLAALDPVNQNVVAEDTLSLPDFGTLHRILGFAPALTTVNGLPAREVFVGQTSLLPDLGAAAVTIPGPAADATYSTTNFAFIRKARPMLGEPLLQLTGDNAIDASVTTPGNVPYMSLANYSADASGSFIDVLFAPNGEVLNTTAGKTILWVRNTSLPAPRPTYPMPDVRANFEASGQMSLIVIYTKTGAIATQPVTLTGDPYAATKDGFNTGL